MAGQFLLKADSASRKALSADDLLSLLPLTGPELRKRILEEIERNPVLVADDRGEAAEEIAPADPDLDLPVMEWMADPHRPSLRTPVHTPQEVHEGFLRSLPDRHESLCERLHQQFLLVEGDPWKRWIGEQIIFNLDERGYVRGDFGKLVASINGALAGRARDLLAGTKGAIRRSRFSDVPPSRQPDQRLAQAMLRAMDELGALRVPLVRLLEGLEVTTAEAEGVLRTIQGLDPAGVGARDLRECLLLQIADRGGPPLAKRLIQRCLPDVEAGRLSKVARRLGTPLARVRAAARVVLSLDRAPGLSIGTSEGQGVAPDAAIERDNGGWRIRIERAGVPRLTVSRRYRRRLRETFDPDTRAYLAKNFQDARRLLAALRERDRILRLILRAVVEGQKTHPSGGTTELAPVYMKDVARWTGLPLRTIARAVDGKTVRTTRGVIPIRALFAAGDRKSRRAGRRGRG